jgi:DNA polymerase I-like protein with 3'-5' exonuclease and polymerase domains
VKIPACTVIDFETLEIQNRPNFPPEPVGVSIQEHGKKAKYWAWGHPTGGNNCSKADAVRALKAVWCKGPMLFFNAKFDVAVAVEKLGLKMPSWELIHDAMYVLYLHDPHAPDLRLKPASERLLQMPPDERDEVKEWLWDHRKQLEAQYGIRFSRADTGKNTWAKYIAYCPGDIVEAYANGDCERTRKLFRLLYIDVSERGMLPAYDREREVMPIFYANERDGVRVDLERLRRDEAMYSQALEDADKWLRKRLKKKDLNLDNDNEVVDAFVSNGIIPDDEWTWTAGGATKAPQRSLKKDNLRPTQYTDARVASAFGYRNRLSTCLKMFMRPWLAQAEVNGGRISTHWNQVRGTSGGTRTGRPSTSDPNFLNISKSWHDKDDGYIHPHFIRGLPELPLVRVYILPDAGEIFGHRDFNGQELRILGHYEDGALLGAYRDDPSMDVHAFVKGLILDITGLDYHRTQVKVTNFRRIYGGGAPATAGALNISMAAAKELLAAHGRALPGVQDLNREIKAMVARGEPITTWGGREYYVEPPKFDKKYNRHMTYEYKLLNYLIQGSAADITKQAIINYISHPKRRGRFMVTVYDEINASMPAKYLKEEMAILRDCMESIDLDVPLLSEGKTGPSWGEAVKYIEPASKYARKAA